MERQLTSHRGDRTEAGGRRLITTWALAVAAAAVIASALTGCDGSGTRYPSSTGGYTPDNSGSYETWRDDVFRQQRDNSDLRRQLYGNY